MSNKRLFLLTTMAMMAFAGNSLLCRLALAQTEIDAASFTSIRLISGAGILWLLANLRKTTNKGNGDWLSAFALFIYAAGFSFAYIHLSAATGALLLFGAVQVTMICFGLFKGERFALLQTIGFVLAISGLIVLFLPGLQTPPLYSSLLMLLAGIAWGVYSIRGRKATHPLAVTTGNFIRTVPITLVLTVLMLKSINIDIEGVIYAILSGMLASGVGYAIWYSALPFLKATHDATIQLSVPVIAAFGGVILLAEPISLRLLLASIAILGGINLILFKRLNKC